MWEDMELDTGFTSKLCLIPEGSMDVNGGTHTVRNSRSLALKAVTQWVERKTAIGNHGFTVYSSNLLRCAAHFPTSSGVCFITTRASNLSALVLPIILESPSFVTKVDYLSSFAGVGIDVPTIGNLFHITFRYLLEIISPIVGRCETLGHLPSGNLK